MRLVLLIVTVLLVLTTTTLAGPECEITNSTVNFGRVTQHKILTSDFWVKAVGDEDLKIEMLWSGCGCTDIPLTDSVIKAGDSLSLRIIFSTGSFKGLITKKPEIRTNADDQVVKLSLIAEVVSDASELWPVVLRPDALDISQYTQKTRRIGKFHLENRSDEDLRVTVMDTALKSFEIKIPDRIKAGETIEGKVRVLEDKVTSDFNESVTFRLDGEETYYYTLPLRRRYRPLD